MKLARKISIVACVFMPVVSVFAEDPINWDNVSFIPHSTYQAVNSDGSSAYNGGFEIRLIGVVLNNTEDWLDPTPNYDSGYTPWYMGGESEFYVQAVDLSGTPYDKGLNTDFGGTACWIGQNYGNHVKHQHPSFNYSDADWTDELARLNLFGGTNVTDPIRAGDLVEIQVRIGLNYKGKMNVNENHEIEDKYDFEIVRLEKNFGLPTPTAISLSHLKDEYDVDIFDATRSSGGEKYQSTLVELQDVYVTSAVNWSTDTDIEVTDGTRTFTVHLGLNDSFDGTELFAPYEHFNAVGILDQKASYGNPGTNGYQLLVMNAGDITPEPASMIVLSLGVLPLLRRRRRG